MVTIRVTFAEKATDYRYPIVTHEFTGRDLEEARGYFRAHLKYDRMLKAVDALGFHNGRTSGSFQGIEFRSTIRVIQF